MSDVDFIKSKLGVYPGFPKEVSKRMVNKHFVGTD